MSITHQRIIPIEERQETRQGSVTRNVAAGEVGLSNCGANGRAWKGWSVLIFGRYYPVPPAERCLLSAGFFLQSPPVRLAERKSRDGSRATTPTRQTGCQACRVRQGEIPANETAVRVRARPGFPVCLHSVEQAEGTVTRGRVNSYNFRQQEKLTSLPVPQYKARGTA